MVGEEETGLTAVRGAGYPEEATSDHHPWEKPVNTPQRPAEPHDNNDGQGDAVEPAPPSRPGRTAYRRGAANPNGSTTALRADVLAALGVLKVATADQLQRLLRPGEASNTVIRQALRDLALHGLVASDGNTRDRDVAAGGRGRAGRGRGRARDGPLGDGRHRPGRRLLPCPARDGGQRDDRRVRPGRQRARGGGRGRHGAVLVDRDRVRSAGRQAQGAPGRGVAGPSDRGAGADGRGRPLHHGPGRRRRESTHAYLRRIGGQSLGYLSPWRAPRSTRRPARCAGRRRRGPSGCPRPDRTSGARTGGRRLRRGSCAGRG